jgi:hypothetical protein
MTLGYILDNHLLVHILANRSLMAYHLSHLQEHQIFHYFCLPLLLEERGEAPIQEVGASLRERATSSHRYSLLRRERGEGR